MTRCIELARLGAGYVAPNPMVGAVLVYEGRIIGEGYHQRYGEAHAEVNCVASVKAEDRSLIVKSMLYVSLEPCSHYGKTPPCVDLILREKISIVVIGCRDVFKLVDGKGIEKLKAAGVEVILGVMEKECKELNKRFFTFHSQHRPYIVLKWAQTGDGKIAPPNPLKGEREEPDNRKRLLISNEFSNRLVHKWRSEEASILVGTNTALQDNPELTTRLWEGPSPIRLVVDMDLRLPASLKLFNGEVRTIVFNSIKHEEESKIMYYQVTHDVSLVQQIVNALYHLNIQSVLVEGGARSLQSFIDKGMWDEVRRISNPQLVVHSGLQAPVLANAERTEVLELSGDIVEIFKPGSN